MLATRSGGERLITKSGRELLLDIHVLNRHGARTRWHDALKDCIYESLLEAGVYARKEVFGFVADLVPTPTARARLYEHFPPQQQHSIVPDLLFTDPDTQLDRLADVKTIGWRADFFTGPSLRSGGNRPVDRRAGTVNEAYVGHARRIDEVLAGAAYSGAGPIEQRVRRFQGVRGLVFGPFGEASQAVHDLAHLCGREIAKRTWSTSGCASLDEAIAAQTARVFREWGVTASLARARCTLACLNAAVEGAVTTPAGRRGEVAVAQTARARADAYDLRGGPHLLPVTPPLGSVTA